MNKKKIIITICICTLLILLLILSIIFRKYINQKNALQTMSDVDVYIYDDNEDYVEDVEDEKEIVNIEDLEEEKEEQEEQEVQNQEPEKAESQPKKPTINSTSPYYIKINYLANVVNIYTKNENGEYVNPFKVMVCSTGTETPRSGQYKIQYRWRWLGLIGNVYGQYSTQIVGDILFHSVPYTATRQDCLEYWEYDKLGTSASAGCIRLQVSDAKWIYDNVPSGTIVEFYADSNPGPFGKPSARKISDNTTCRNWDPTDPSSDNPWNTYVEPQPEPQPEPEPEPDPKPEPDPDKGDPSEGDKDVDIYS